MMIEVFKTNVEDQDQADQLIDRIHQCFSGYIANFDLDDCDKILRVKSSNGSVKIPGLIDLLSELGFHAEVLTD